MLEQVGKARAKCQKLALKYHAGLINNKVRDHVQNPQHNIFNHRDCARQDDLRLAEQRNAERTRVVGLNALMRKAPVGGSV
ncbi:unnamed protein product [Gongylonema pulchrum]|uniref:Transposase n=1 Tax=Gongylonema pulchrum TaxID=637853 RepID=A0A183DNU2_9BILA|nr:unnamed protein product [Gongylonema pulchrum]